MDDGRNTRLLLAAGIATLLIIASAIVAFDLPLTPTLGIACVAYALWLPPREALILSITAALTAMVVLLIVQFEDELIRFSNATLAAALAVSVSWAIDQRVKRISSFQRTQTSLFASVPDGLVVLDPAGTVLECNEGLQTLVPQAEVGERFHPALGHILVDGSQCPGGCRLDGMGDAATVPVSGESITRKGQQVPIGYTTARVDVGTIVSIRDLSSVMEAQENRRAVLESAVRQGEQETLLRTLGAPAYSELPTIPGLELDMFSSHAPSEWAGGGDLVHVAPMPDGRILVSIVDALEQGVISLRDAWKVHYVSQSYVMSGTALEDVIPRTVATLQSEPEMPNASLMLALVNPEDGCVELVGGGHPPALLIRSTGASEWLEGGGPGIGFGSGGSQTVHTRQLVPGDSLVFYTDGLIDGTDDVIEALSSLRASAAALRKGATEGWARTLTETVMARAQNSGSATALLVRVSGDSGSRQTTASL